MKFLLIFFIISCTTGLSEKNQNSNNNEFDNFIELFQPIKLPLILNRKEIFNLATYNTDQYKLIPRNFQTMLPNEILSKTLKQQIRGIFILPQINDQIPLIIAKDYFENDEQRSMELYLIIYSKEGNVLGFHQVAGFRIDAIESFVTISENYDIIISNYQHRLNPKKKYPKLFYIIETIYKCKIITIGNINCSEETSKEGYFESNLDGYKFIRNE